jgi:putative ABC transport system ATP-binding protein
MSNGEALIKTEKLNKTFSNGKLQTPVLFDIDLQISHGEFVAIMGPSGCGKSTLMHILGTMLSPTSGKVIIDGVDVTALNDSARARLRRDTIGFVFQRFNLLTTLNAYQNIAVAERIRGHELDGQITSALEAVQMADKAYFKPGQLSIGQQQRIAIARAISHRPKILLADEPTGNLDSANTQRIMELFRQVHKSYGVTIVMITHSQTACQWANRVITMNDGRI